MPTLKQKTVSGLTWSFIDNFSNQGISFIVGIVLARILSPAEFGLIGMITIFIAISQSLIDSGFSQALIRKKDCTETDYSTTFYFNVFVAFFLYFLLFALSKSISIFYHEPKLTDLIRVLGLVLLINSFSLIQRTILVKQINFKLLTKISIISSVLSGFIGIFLAFKGYGVWSLVVKTIVQQLAISVLLWIWNHWRPSILFSYKILKNLFGFGSKLMAAGLINTIYQNIYYLVIGKFFSATQLGYYTRADQFNSLPSANITGVIQRVSYPVLTELQDEPEKLKAGYKKLIISTTFITFSALIGMASMAQPMILTLIGEKWLPVVQLLQILCFAAMLFPLHSLNLNLLLVKGRSDLYLKLEIIKKAIVIPIITIGIWLGIKYLVWGIVLNSFFAYYLNSYWSGRLIHYSIKNQIGDIFPSFALSFSVGIIVFLIGRFTPLSPPLLLIIQIIFWMLLTYLLAEIFKIKAYIEIKEIAKEQYQKLKTNQKK